MKNEQARERGLLLLWTRVYLYKKRLKNNYVYVRRFVGGEECGGDWVSGICGQHIDPSGPGALVGSRFDMSTEYAESSFALANGFMTQLKALLNDFEPPGTDDINGIAIPDLQPLSCEGRPAIGNLVLPDIPDSDVSKPQWAAVPSFSGTYVLHTLGEAVEELINGHYKDGSDDQLLVYLLEGPNMIEEEVT